MRKRRNVTLKVGESALFHGGPNQEFQIVPREDGDPRKGDPRKGEHRLSQAEFEQLW